MAKQKKPYYERVAEEVIKALEEGTAPWIKPWEPGQQPDLPTNALTGKPYRGWNRIYLSMLQPGEADNRWCTYKQATELGAQVRKGEKGAVIQYWQYQEKKLITDDEGKPILDDKGEKQYSYVELERPRAIHSVVFHASQIDGLPPLPPRKERPEWERHDDAEKLLTASGAIIHHDQHDRAFYRPGTDQIHMPERGQFPTSDKYYATALHELGHWTGHPSRLDRDLAHPFGSEGYAREELRAELASYMLGSELGIGHDPGQHTAYIQSWIKILKDDPQEILRASRDAQKIMDYIQGLVQEQTQAQEIRQTSRQQTEPEAFFDSVGTLRHWDTAEPMPADWQGIAKDTARFFYVGREGEERTFTVLKAESFEEAQQEAAIVKALEAVDIRDVINAPGVDLSHIKTFQGENLEDALRSHGITSVHSATGHDPARFSEMASLHISNVFGAPFGKRLREDDGIPYQECQELTQLFASKAESIYKAVTQGQEINQHDASKEEIALNVQTEGILTALEAAGWERSRNEPAIAFKSFASDKDAAAFLTPGDGFNRTLQFQYFSEGRNVTEANGVLIPINSTAEQAYELVTAAAARAEQSIRSSVRFQIAEMNQKQTEKQHDPTEQAVAQTAQAERQYIYVPYREKDEAKRLGARWDRGAKSWYVPQGTNLAAFSKWLPENNKIRQELPQDPRAEFAEALKDAGLKIEGLPQMDGKLHRVPVEGDEKGKRSGAYKGYLDGHPAGFIQNFKSGYKANWKATGQRLNPAEIAKLEREAEAKRQAREREREAGYLAKSQAITQELARLPDAPADHPYLKGKGLHGAGHAFGAKMDDQGNLVIPIEDKEGKVWSVQRIGPTGFKGYEKGSKVSGCYHVIGGKDALAAQDAHEPLLISTGFGTSASIHMATGRPVVVAFQDNNLKDVAQEFKQMFPERTIVVLGDDDRHLPERKPPLPNSGRVKANEAAKAVGGRAIFPQFTAQEKGREFTDFSDLHRARGLAAVQRQVEQALAQARTTVNARNQREQMLEKKQEREKEREEQRRSKSRGEARSLGL